MAERKKKTANRRNRPDDIKTKEDLMTYLLAHPDSELPFVEECWTKAVEKAEANKTKETPEKYEIVINPDGTEERKKVLPRGNAIKDPVSQYFKLISLPCYKKIGEDILRRTALSGEQDDIYKQYFQNSAGEDGENKYANEILSWIDMFSPLEREFLRRRYAVYMDLYEINEGADRTSLKRLLSLEIEAHRIDTCRAKGKEVNINDEKKISELIQSTLESMKWTKKQRSARDEFAQSKFTVWMDKLVKDGEFIPPKREYDKDEIDALMDNYIECARRMLS
ncbi:hypothetical protein [Eubacterium limosum]|uniref:hypothetical protein n=1 Tax=Eubacterium limosum TaxID=1736 RepID=UPI001062D5DC|nr:hypothetical protein [Eubacterium limosum]